MPWTAASFHKHNRKLSPAQSAKAAKVANAILAKTGDEGKAIRIANAQFEDKPGLQPLPPRAGRA